MRLKLIGSSLFDCMISLAIMSVGMLGLAELNLQQLKRLTLANEQQRALGSASDTAAFYSAHNRSALDTEVIQPPGIQIVDNKGHKLLLVSWISAHGGPNQLTLPLP